MENLKKIIKQFPKVGEVKEIKALTSGLINQTYLVKSVSPEEPDYVLQRINHLIFTNIEMLQHNIEVVTRHTRQKLEADTKRTLNVRYSIFYLPPMAKPISMMEKVIGEFQYLFHVHKHWKQLHRNPPIWQD
jgi:hypothetical protein